MTESGLYSAQQITKEEFINIIKKYYELGELESYLGYKNNIDIIEKWTGIRFDMSRESHQLNDEDSLLVMKLKYRTTETFRKGQLVDEEDFEFMLIKFNKVLGRN